MSKKKLINRIIFIIIVIILILISYSFLYGKLFPYSPLKIGFTKYEQPNTVIYIQNGAEFSNFKKIDTLIPAVENFHQLKFISKPEIFIFRDSSSFISRSPSKARFCVFYNGRLVISPWALRESSEGKISLVIYLRHELSHTLIYQHTGIINAIRYPKWLLEGIAVYSSNQMGTSFYPSKKETYELIRKGYFMPPEFYGTKNEENIKLDFDNSIAFVYSEFACIVDYLIQKHGFEKFLTYMKQLIDNPGNNEVFKQIYNMDFGKFISEFKEYVNNTSD